MEIPKIFRSFAIMEDVYIGNIVTKVNFIDKPPIGFRIYKSFKDVDNLDPVLIVGWKEAKLIYGDSFNILNKNLNTHTYWTFKPTDDIDEFNRDLNDFKNHCFSEKIKGYTFTPIDLYRTKMGDIKKIIKYLNKNKFYYYLDKNNLYLQLSNKIYGFDINSFEYFNTNLGNVLSKLKKNRGGKYISKTFFNTYKYLLTNNEQYAGCFI